MKLTATAAVAATAVAVAVAGTASGQTGSTITVTATTNHFHFVDNPPAQKHHGPASMGDVFVLQGPVQGGGAAHLDCTVTVPGKHGANLCHGLVALPKGGIAIEGLVHDGTNADDLAVTGGTGAYAGAAGTLHTQSKPHNRDVLTFTLK